VPVGRPRRPLTARETSGPKYPSRTPNVRGGTSRCWRGGAAFGQQLRSTCPRRRTQGLRRRRRRSLLRRHQDRRARGRGRRDPEPRRRQWRARGSTDGACTNETDRLTCPLSAARSARVPGTPTPGRRRRVGADGHRIRPAAGLTNATQDSAGVSSHPPRGADHGRFRAVDPRVELARDAVLPKARRCRS